MKIVEGTVYTYLRVKRIKCNANIYLYKRAAKGKILYIPNVVSWHEAGEFMSSKQQSVERLAIQQRCA